MLCYVFNLNVVNNHASCLCFRNRKNALIRSRVLEYCTPGMCLSECLNYVRDVKMDPCYRGEVDQVTRKRAMRQDPQSVFWYAAFDSCDVELTKEACALGVNSAPPPQHPVRELTMIMSGMILTLRQLF